MNRTDPRIWQIDLDTDSQVEKTRPMANEEHLARLQEGVEAWNAWREANPGISPDLMRADLIRTAVDFRGWKRSNAKFDVQFERVIQALWADAGAREALPTLKL
jgi:hypothetical protein